MAAAAVTPRNQTRVPDSGRANTAASVPRQAGAAQLPPLEDTGATLAAPRTAAASRNHPVQANDADRDLPRVADATGAAAAESRADAAPAPQAAQPNPATTIVAPDVAPVLQRPANAVNDPARHSSTAPAPAGLANAAASRPAEAPASPEPSRLADAATPAAPGRSNGAAPAQERFSTLLAAGAERSDAAASWNINLPAAAADSGADTVRLTGQSTQWQQPLREALGERLQVQLGRNAEHAVIRLDPPMLGRIEISIRHSAGTLQVHLAASNSEVLQQLHAIGDGMRQDLSQRQYSDVSVNIAPTPRSPAAQAFSQGDADGRQRQSGRDQDEDAPNRALSEAGQPSSTFALNGLE